MRQSRRSYRALVSTQGTIPIINLQRKTQSPMPSEKVVPRHRQERMLVRRRKIVITNQRPAPISILNPTNLSLLPIRQRIIKYQLSKMGIPPTVIPAISTNSHIGHLRSVRETLDHWLWSHRKVVVVTPGSISYIGYKRNTTVFQLHYK